MESSAFANQLAASKSVQGIVRALGLFCKGSGQSAELRLEYHPEGAVIHFGSDQSGSDRHTEFAALLEKSDRLGQLESAISIMKDMGVDSSGIELLIAEAMGLAKELYPNLPSAHWTGPAKDSSNGSKN